MFCHHPFYPSRLKTREVDIGGISLGGSNPIRIQSMTITDTMDIEATANQTISLARAGCDYVRITAPNIKAAEQLKNIQNKVRKAGFNVPLIADIHFTPKAAEIAAKIVNKVRINPGNYADRKMFKNIDYNNQCYREELERVYQRFFPLVKICKEYGTAMRIGCNHGSLSDRILSRYGDTPKGMVQAALEFVDICEDIGYYSIVISMKASNPKVMVHAYRLLVEKMLERQTVYPIHLGVTEAGEGEDGRIKSAIGIGNLLADGIGDTIRVSLTGEPEIEVPAAKAIIQGVAMFNSLDVSHFENVKGESSHSEISSLAKNYNPFQLTNQRKKSPEFLSKKPPLVICNFNELSSENLEKEIGLSFNRDDKLVRENYFCDGVIFYQKNIPYILEKLKTQDDFYLIRPFYQITDSREVPLFESIKEYKKYQNPQKKLQVLKVKISEIVKDIKEKKLNLTSNIVLLLVATNKDLAQGQLRQLAEMLNLLTINPIIWITAPQQKKIYRDLTLKDSRQIDLALCFSNLLLDGELGGVVFNPDREDSQLNHIWACYQSVRSRISKTEYISCPSCGRTLFDLQEVSAKIRKKTNHLKGVKIGIMGCIVNGPGEMADADFGYVGTGPGKISLYKGQEMVEKSIDESVAVDKLIELIKRHGKWVEPPVIC